MPDVNIMEHIGSDGKFADTFKDQITAIAGEDFKESKIFDDVPDVATLVKNYAKTKQDYGRKLEGVIQKPGEKATDAEKAEYTAALNKARGAPDSADEYEIVKPEDMPEGMGFDEEAEKEFREFFMSQGTPTETVKALSEMFNAWQLRRFQAHLDEENKVFEEASKTLQNDWKGDDMVKNARSAHAALMEFGNEDLTRLIKESKIYDTAGDLVKWNSLGFSPSQLRIWHNIGDKMKSSEHIPDEGGAGGGEKTDKQKKIGSIYPHPSSVRDRELRAKAKE